MENRKRNIQMKFYVTEEEKRLIDEKMKQLPIKQYGAYFRKMAIDGYILVVDRSDTKAYIRELQAVSRNINQIAKRANATGTVYRQDRGLFLPVQLLCGKLLKRCGHNVRVPAFEKHKVTGLLALNLF